AISKAKVRCIPLIYVCCCKHGKTVEFLDYSHYHHSTTPSIQLCCSPEMIRARREPRPPVFTLHCAAGAGSGFSEGGEQLGGAGCHEIKVRAGHHELESLFLVSLDFLAGAGRTAEELAVTFCRGNDLSDGFVEFGMRLAAAKSERKG